MKARNLREAINTLNPEKPLRTRDQLEAYFVERPWSPLKALKVLLEDSEEPQKILFTGHRGSGKTTELAKLADNLKNEFFIIQCSAERHLNLFDLTHADVILSLGLELLDQVKKQSIPVNNKILGSFHDFTKKIVLEIEDEEKKILGGELEGGIPDIATLTGKYKTEDTTRINIRKSLDHCLQELFENIDFLAQEIKIRTGRPVLAFVEDLDKTDIQTAEDLFYKHAASLLTPRLAIIFTFPIELRFDNNFMHIRSSFPTIVALPNINLRHRDNSPNDSGKKLLENILAKRLEEHLIMQDALISLVESSGGIPRELIALARGACVAARVADKTSIDEESAAQAVQDRRRDYEVLLPAEQRVLLEEIARNKWADNNEKYQPLLKNLSALEYRNGDPWFDVHPLVKPLLGKKTL
jgi:hypothetical protein